MKRKPILGVKATRKAVLRILKKPTLRKIRYRSVVIKFLKEREKKKSV